ncbi:hypothetical protein SynA1562_00595 [Synechococcus sp. A15-62]|uniref:hypothetical protein n=1 Tax=Synechococcus sp. A15-62 TaxID=1050657 RepID=UPI00164822DD|nr:hypothetical protein [Synechococcus sp. A15-62]QNI99441.1 hypothetical protein SynA1562_00595 [Synechococcus sp. A15-62]
MSENQLVNRFDAIPPHIIKALTLCANGSTWADAAAAVGIKAPCLRKWYRDRRAEEFIEALVRENLNVANNLLTSAAPRLADELIQIALDPNVKAYARTQAISESFKILRENVLEQEQRRQLQEVRDTLQALETEATCGSQHLSHVIRPITS